MIPCQLGPALLDALNIDPTRVSDVRLIMTAGGPDRIEVVRLISGEENAAILAVLEGYAVKRVE